MKNIVAVMLTALSVFGCGATSPDTTQASNSDTTDSKLSCLANSPWLEYGEGLDGSSSKTVPPPASTAPVSSVPECKDNQKFKFGMGKADITGRAAGAVMLGIESPSVYTSGIYTRQFARSMIVESPCNGKRVALVVTDLGLFYEAERQTVLAEIAADPDLAGVYTEENLMMNVTHSHSGPGGQAHYQAYNTLRAGHVPEALEVVVAGIMRSLRQAHDALEGADAPGSILLNQGELLNTNKSRAIPAYMNNPESERQQYLDDSGNAVYNPKLMSLLKLVSPSGVKVGTMNWFGVHPTSDYSFSSYTNGYPISGDNKGYAALRMEKIMANDNPNFVAAFSQADEGDAFTDLWFDNPEKRADDAALLPPNEPAPVTVVNGHKQLLRAMTLFQDANEKLSGPVDYRMQFVQMDQQEITDQVVLDSLIHPPELDADPKRTCGAALGVSFPAGGGGAKPGEVSGGQTRAGVTCSDPDAQTVATAAAADLQTLADGGVPPNAFAATVGCNAGDAPGANMDCHAEKPILLILGPPANGEPSVIPMQLFRIGNLAIIGLPWEVTTMAGRRLRDTVLAELKKDGVDYAVINGLSNGYMHYLTTREEYAIQQYEGASNVFGPWSLAAVQQTFRGLALDMINASPTTVGQPDPLPEPQPQNPSVHNTDAPAPGTNFGDVIQQPNASYAPGDTVHTIFQASSPNSDFKVEGSFLFVEKQAGDAWEVIAVDTDTETTFLWQTDTPEPQANSPTESTAEIFWRIPRNTEPGTFRIRFEGVANQGDILTSYEGQSEQFLVSGPVADCP